DSRIVVSNNDSGQVFRQVFDREAQTESAQDTEQSRSAGMTMLKDKKLVIFETTPLMSTYLLYLGIGEFEFLEDKYKDILLRVVTTPGKKQYGKFALECAKNSLEYFEEYFDYLYPLKKLDLIAVPEFATGAMENWGAITFRENALLFYPDKSSKATMQRIAEVVAHEIAHQWFGNLVTMKWWDDLWLNESFATYMAYKVTDYHWPEWKVWDQYITDTVFEGMTLDSLKSSHPIKVTVKNTSELEELFDEIAYEKGGSILRMLDLYLRGTDFRDGLRKYIKAYQYNNAEAKDLWRTLENISAKPILDMMQKYVTQVGFPMIKIELKNNIISLRQNRFLFDEEPSGMKQLWFIPYHLDDARHQDGIFLLENKVKEIKMVKEMNYLNINKNYLSFFITEYSEDLLENLGKNLAGLKNSEKLGLIHDLFALILAGKIDLQNLYHFIDSFFIKEESSILLHYIISKLTGIFLLMRDETSKKLAIKYSKRALELVGYEPENNENILDSYLRAAALSSLTLFEDKEVASFVNKKFLRYLENEKSLHPDLRAIVYSSSVWFNESNHRIIKNLYKTSLVQEEKAKFLMALGNSKNKKLIKETLEYSFQQDVPFAFLPYIVSSTARNPKAKEIVLDWLLRNWSLLVKRSGGMANMLLRRILQSIIPICGIRKEMKVENFLETNKIKGLERTIKQVLEQLKINSRLVRKYKN
ncbi:M1 family metallopeptidase, partial [Candidatus Roizmanbacteria bacterium]|nr:M1 family metallopeptidase [Candidatus Roizmanbacteria bacterium]